MKSLTLDFYDKDAEITFQDKEHKDRIFLFRYYPLIKLCLEIIEIIFDIFNKENIEGFKLPTSIFNHKLIQKGIEAFVPLILIYCFLWDYF